MKCGCHDEQMYWTKDKRYTAGGFWRCAVKQRAQVMRHYDADPIARITKLLKERRRKALLRTAENVK